MMFLFQALTMTSTFWSSKSPLTMVGSFIEMDCQFANSLAAWYSDRSPICKSAYAPQRQQIVLHTGHRFFFNAHCLPSALPDA
jgi:hypothetical protein